MSLCVVHRNRLHWYRKTAVRDTNRRRRELRKPVDIASARTQTEINSGPTVILFFPLHKTQPIDNAY
jgi:hypothetical protein